MLPPETKSMVAKIPQICLLSVEKGTSCKEIMTKWHYDIKSDTCYPFDYTGCGSEQANRFEDETECLNHCSITQYKNNQTQLTDTEASSIILKC